MEKEETKRKILDFSEILGPGAFAAMNTELTSRFTVNKDQIKNAIEGKDIVRLRQYSQYFYHASGEYRRLVDYFGGILTNDNVIIPLVEEENIEEKSFKRRYRQVLDYAEKSHIKDTCNQIGKIIVRDGAFFGYERDLDGQISLQPLPAQYCRSRFQVSGVYATEFDFAYFDKFTGDDKIEILSAFAPEFTTMYAKYLEDRVNEKWQMLDPLYARAHLLESPIPMLSPVFLDLIELEEYKRIDKTKSQLDIYKILVQKIPLNNDNELTFELPEIKQFHSNLRKMVKNSAVDVVTTPCDVESVSLQDKNQTVKDDIAKATNIIYSTAGTPMMIFNPGHTTGSIGLRESIRVDENIMLPLLQQYERWYLNKMESISGKYKFKIIFPPITQFNRKEMMELYDKGATQGFPTKLLTMAALGLSQNDFDFLLNYENNILKLHEKMIPTSSAYQTPGGQENGGRPESEEPLSDEGGRTRDERTNDDRAGGE